MLETVTVVTAVWARGIGSGGTHELLPNCSDEAAVPPSSVDFSTLPPVVNMRTHTQAMAAREKEHSK